MIQAVPSSTSERDYSMGEWRRRQSFTISYDVTVSVEIRALHTRPKERCRNLRSRSCRRSAGPICRRELRGPLSKLSRNSLSPCR